MDRPNIRKRRAQHFRWTRLGVQRVMRGSIESTIFPTLSPVSALIRVPPAGICPHSTLFFVRCFNHFQ